MTSIAVRQSARNSQLYFALSATRRALANEDQVLGIMRWVQLIVGGVEGALGEMPDAWQ